jgi:hypothetical protein
VAQVLSPASGQRGVVRLLDPCCGEGLALEALGQALAQRSGKAVQTWGVEISPERAKEAAARLDLVIPAPFEAVSWSPARHGVASVLFLNPPYDHNDRGGRIELDFIKASLGALVSGGTLVYVIPTTAVDYSLGEFLFRHFQDVRVFRFGDQDGTDASHPDSGFDRFKQIVILATRRKQSLKALYEDQEAQGASYAFVEAHSQTYAYRHDRSLEERIPVTLPEGTLYAIPAARKAANIRRYRYADGESEGLVAGAWPKVEAQIAEVMLASDAEIAQPLKPPKTGHIAQIVAAGLAGVIETGGSVFKGRVVKVTEVTPDPEDESKEIARERYETNVVSVSPEGLSHLASPPAVGRFLQRHVDVFKQYIADHFKPYGNTATPAEERVLDRLALLQDGGVESAIRELVLKARKYGLWCVLGGQSWKASVLDTTIHDQLASRVQFKAMSASQSRVLLERGGAERLDVPGRALAILPGRELIEMQAPYISHHAIAQALTDGGPRRHLPETTQAREDVEQAGRIHELAGRGLSKRQIALEVFGYTGGAAYTAVTEALETATTTAPHPATGV